MLASHWKLIGTSFTFTIKFRSTKNYSAINQERIFSLSKLPTQICNYFLQDYEDIVIKQAKTYFHPNLRKTTKTQYRSMFEFMQTKLKTDMYLDDFENSYSFKSK